MSNVSLVEGITIYVPVFLLSITIHEYFHAWSAYKFGDSTAKDLGRLTLMPHAHLDFLGTAVFFLSSFTFGWAKPVPVNPFNLKNPKIIYGGSVNTKNITELKQISSINGFLIGGSSQNAKNFIDIIKKTIN